MSGSYVKSAANLLGCVAAGDQAIGVGVSFGKDSLATLDLCARTFRRVEAYYLYRVRDLECVGEWAEAVRRRYGITVRMYPHFDLSRCYRAALLQPHWDGLDRVPRLRLTDIEAHFRAEADVRWIAYGWRRNDSYSRALIMQQCRGIDWEAARVFPLRAWRRVEVYGYLDHHRIPRPPALGRREQGGLDFVEPALRFLIERYPRDWRRWLVDFPFSPVQFRPGAAQCPPA